ncbi:MAG: TraB family protein, partial [Acidobacteria bacterium]
MTEQDNVRILEVDGRTVHLVGTAHVSRESVEEVRRVIESVRPDTVVVELDDQRLEAMTDEERWRRLDIFQVIRQRKVPFLLASLALASYQERIGRRLGVRPGA